MVAVAERFMTVLLGAALGALLRLGSEWAMVHRLSFSTEYSLLVVNCLGCVAFAYCAGVLRQPKAKLFWLTGCWGTYTSFSAVSGALLLMLKTTTSDANLAIYAIATGLSWWLGFAMGHGLSRVSK